MKITPNLVPHRDFHKGKWLLPVNHPSWYYFKKSSNHNKVTNKDFIKSVDAPLRELVKFLHKKGIKTTASCSGHHLSKRDLEKIYEDLKEDSVEIRHDGIKMKDIETGDQYFLKDKNYHLPWDKDGFLHRIKKYQQKGVLGMKLGNRKRIKNALLQLNIEGVRVEEKDSVVFIFTNEGKHIKATWQKITEEVKKIFG
jgi:hypothetical protein